MRVKVALIIIVIAFIIISANLASSMLMARQSLTETMAQDIIVLLHIADDLVSTKINLFKSNAQTIAERLMRKETEEEMLNVMREQLAEYTDFLSCAVFDRQGIVLEYGDFATTSEWFDNSKYIRAAFEGQSVISTTSYNEERDELVMHIFAPMGGDHALSVTICGMTFTELLDDYLLWETGNIFMIDAEGTLIAYYLRDRIRSRVNLFSAIDASTSQETVDFLSEMLVSSVGQGTYTYNGIEYLSAFMRVSGSELGWRIGVAVPLRESPVSRVQNRLILLAVSFFIVSVIVSIFCSGHIAKPYNKITEQNRRLEELNEVEQSQTSKLQEAHYRTKLMMEETLRLQFELEEALKEAQEANNAKSSFLAKMSHEMRTPLNAVIGLSELILSTDEMYGDTEDKLGKIRTSGMTLLGIVNDILDISKIESGKLALHPTEYNTPSLIYDIISLNTVRLGEKPINFVLKLDERLPLQICGDDLRVKQVFNNLLSNAFKYTNSGSVIWSVTFEREGESVWLISDIKDTGIGIKQEDTPKLFMDYSQVDEQTNRKAEGTGLGLSITKRFVDMMDGTINVESEYGKGSVFSVRLRQKFVTDVAIGKETVDNLIGDRFTIKRKKNTAIAQIDLSYAHVLVVDDTPTNLDVAKGVLKLYRLKVDCATGGKQAIEMIRAENPRYDAVFMDHMMPGMDGIEATQIIREQIGTTYARNIPIIALTANAIAGNEKMFLMNGFQDFISKPIDMLRLDLVLRQWVRDRAREMERDIERGYCELGSQVHSSKMCDSQLKEIIGNEINVSAGMERFFCDEEVYVEMLQSYTDNTRVLLKEMQKYLSENNLADYAITIHGIKGASFGICAEEIGKSAQELERLAKTCSREQMHDENKAFRKEMKNLLDSIDSALKIYYSKREKPVAAAPDSSLLKELRDACKSYDAGNVNRIMKLLESYDYKNGAETITWLKEQTEQMNYSIIADEIWRHM